MFYNSRAFTFTQSVNALPLTNSVTADRIGCPCVIYLSGVFKKKKSRTCKIRLSSFTVGEISGGARKVVCILQAMDIRIR